MRPEFLEKKTGYRINMEKKLVWIGLGILLLLTICYLLFGKKDERMKDKQTINEGFQASPTFQGSRKNKVFKLGNKGLGYYLDKKKNI